MKDFEEFENFKDMKGLRILRIFRIGPQLLLESSNLDNWVVGGSLFDANWMASLNHITPSHSSPLSRQ